jgi:uncharacterized glyoxalase superfamily protein PhnB
MITRPTITPALRYADAPAAIDFLCNAFGFERHAVYADPDDPAIIHHAQLSYGNGLIMLSSERDDAAKALYRWKTAGEAGGITACICVVIDDVDAHHARALAAGADIVTPPHDNPGYPGRSYNARDPEGNDWDFGTYNPWA